MEGNCNFLIRLYFDLGMTYTHICMVLAQSHGIILSERHLKRLLSTMNLSRRRYSDLAEVVQFIQQQLQGSGQLHGYRVMYTKCQQNGFLVRKEDVRLILKQLDPAGVSQRASRRLVRRAYYSKGPNYTWHVDGYDKLKPYGLCISGCIDGYSRNMIWLNVYHTNNDPKVIGGYYLEAVKDCGGCPCVVRTDFGTENVLVRDFQEFLRRDRTDDLVEKVYIDGASTCNQRIESWWGFLRKECADFWMNLFKHLMDIGIFTGSFLDKNLIQFCFMSLLQGELDNTAEMWNAHSIRPSRNDRVPSGRPSLMYHIPVLWASEDQLCLVSEEDMAECRDLAKFRSVIPCDSDIYDICIDIINKDNLDMGHSVTDAMHLYRQLRLKIMSLV